MRRLILFLLRLFLLGVLLGLAAAFLGTTGVILFITLVVIWLVRAAVNGQLAPDRLRQRTGLSRRDKDGPEQETPPEDG